MYRCLLSCFLLLTVGTAAAQQLQRLFPSHALRGTIVFGMAPEAQFNGKSVLLAPGVVVRDTGNLSILTGNVIDVKAKVNVTFDTMGQINQVWILRADEADKFWPKTPDEAAKYVYLPFAQTWVKPESLGIESEE